MKMKDLFLVIDLVSGALTFGVKTSVLKWAARVETIKNRGMLALAIDGISDTLLILRGETDFRKLLRKSSLTYQCLFKSMQKHGLVEELLAKFEHLFPEDKILWEEIRNQLRRVA